MEIDPVTAIAQAILDLTYTEMAGVARDLHEQTGGYVANADDMARAIVAWAENRFEDPSADDE